MLQYILPSNVVICDVEFILGLRNIIITSEYNVAICDDEAHALKNPNHSIPHHSMHLSFDPQDLLALSLSVTATARRVVSIVRGTIPGTAIMTWSNSIYIWIDIYIYIHMHIHAYTY